MAHRPLSTAELAERFGVSPQRVRAIARARGVRPLRRVGMAWLWRAADEKRLRPGPPGRPRRRRR